MMTGDERAGSRERERGERDWEEGGIMESNQIRIIRVM